MSSAFEWLFLILLKVGPESPANDNHSPTPGDGVESNIHITYLCPVQHKFSLVGVASTLDLGVCKSI